MTWPDRVKDGVNASLHEVDLLDVEADECATARVRSRGPARSTTGGRHADEAGGRGWSSVVTMGSDAGRDGGAGAQRA